MYQQTTVSVTITEKDSTGWGGHLFRGFCNMFSESSPCLLVQHGSCSTAQHFTKPSEQVDAPCQYCTDLVLAEAGDEGVCLCPPAPPPPLRLVVVHRRHPPPDHLHLAHHVRDVIVARRRSTLHDSQLWLHHSYTVGRPVIHKVLKIRIWRLPPAGLGSR